jgi:ribosomal protein S11
VDASAFVVLGLGATLFFLVAAIGERLGLIRDETPCDCDQCRKARRDVFRSW